VFNSDNCAIIKSDIIVTAVILMFVICVCCCWRLNVKPEVIIQQLSIRVSSADRSYMPQHIVVSAGCDLSDLHEIKDVRIPRYTVLDLHSISPSVAETVGPTFCC